MGNVFRFIRRHIRVILLYIISIVIVCILFPRGGKFPYEFQMGKTWGHDDLFAPFDFPILKTKQELDAERDSLLKNYVMYYDEHPEVVRHQIKRFGELLEVRWEKSELFGNKDIIIEEAVKIIGDMR